MTLPPRPKSPRPARFPLGRCGTTRFCEITGIGRVTFFTKYRQEPMYIELFDIRESPGSGYLNMSEAAAAKYAEFRKGQLATFRKPAGVDDQKQLTPAPGGQTGNPPNAKPKTTPTKPAGKRSSKVRSADESA